MKDLVLAIIGTMGIAALAMSMNNEQNKPVREDFTQFQMRRKTDKVTKDGMNQETPALTNLGAPLRWNCSLKAKTDNLTPHTHRASTAKAFHNE